MGKHCAAVNCTNNESKEDCRGKSFFGFPFKNTELLKTWDTKIKRLNFVPNKNSRLCSDHFDPSCFRYENFTNRRFLKPDAVPTIFPHNAQKSPRRLLKRIRVEPDTQVSTSADQETEILSPDSRPATNSCDASMQTELSFGDIINELELAIQEKEILNKLLLTKEFKPENISTDTQMRAITGFDRERFYMIFNFLMLEEALKVSNGNGFKLRPIDKFFLFTIKLRTGISYEFLSVLFPISVPTISRYFNFVTDVLYCKFKSLNIWPSKSKIQNQMPYYFLKYFYNCRIIVDCTEIFIQKPLNPLQQQVTFSYYKNHNTMKSLVAITPSGEICFVSDLFCGSVSDKELFCKSGILQKLEPGDEVMTDKGFKISDELRTIGCGLIRPEFLEKNTQFSIEERAKNSEISTLRAHVERAFARVKTFKYFEGNIPYTLLHNLDEVFFIACMFTNFLPPLISMK